MPVQLKGKTALVLAGGGLTGAVYEIGALRAIDDLLVDRTVNDFDIYVGTSAGALVGTFLANGLSPEDMMRTIAGTNPDVPPIERQHIFGINRHDLWTWGMRLPGKLATAGYHYLRNLNDMTLFDLLWSLTEAMPAGLYDGLALEDYLYHALASLGQHNDFNELKRDLYVIATDLDSGERVVFGKGFDSDTPISMAVAASSALPLVYKPVRIGNKEYVDGGLRGTASLDLAVEQGATLVVCINPLVPFDNEGRDASPVHSKKGGYLSEKGIQSIANQSLRIFSHAGLHYHIKQLRRSHPEVDIILIEPRSADYQMFLYNIMHYSARLMVARHGFESVTLDLAVDYAYYKQVLARHGIPMNRRLVIQEMTEIVESDYDPQVIRRVMEARSAGCGQRRQDTPICRLNRALAELDLALDELAEKV
ncbi:MAG TPA: patatin-like phospholipase family protein [Anaerolineales bacterium]